MTNSIARRVVKKYLTQEEPRYALLIDAPWGSGKTHFIEHVTNWKADKTQLYVSLYSVHTAKEFDWALVRAMKPWTDGVSGAWGRQFKEFVSGVKILGCSADLSKVDISEIALESLPNTLIFDDVERCGIPPKQLWGLINRFVEHERKQVILIANSEQHTESLEFLSTREKLVGQVIKIQADVENAISSSWASIPEGQGREILQRHKAIITETFCEAKHQNLRLLLRAVRDAADLIENLEADLIEMNDPLERLVRTYLALHMAFHRADISDEDLKKRGEVGAFFELGKSEGALALKRLQKDHPKADISAASGSIIPVDLARSLFVDGYASKEAINSALRSAHQLVAPVKKPDWVRLWGWLDEEEDELEAIETRIEHRMEKCELTVPGELLQIFGAQEFKGKFLDGFCAKENTRKFYNYIKKLSKIGALPAKIPSAEGSDTVYGFGFRNGTVSYGGYSFEPDKRGKLLMRLLWSEMDIAFEKSLPEVSASLLTSLKSAPLRFRRTLEYGSAGPNYWSIPILYHMDVKECASVLLEHFREDRTLTELLLNTIGDRQRANRTTLEPEYEWIDSLRKQLVEQARAISPIWAAQMGLFVKRHLKPG